MTDRVKVKDDSLIKEIKLIERTRKAERHRKLDISDVIKRYIPIGCSCDYAFAQLDIFLSGYKSLIDKSKVIVERTYDTSLVWGKDVVIVIECDNKTVIDIYAGISKVYP